jgi:hypothetical protein
MRKRWIGVAAAALAGVLAATASAAGPEKTAFGGAKNGTLELTSSVIMLPRAVEMRGGWQDESLPCTDSRTLEVTVEIFWSKGTATKHRTRTRTMTVENCAEGGPNVGFTLAARGQGLACRNGKWRPGDYSFLTVTRDTVTGLEASAVLILTRTTRC